MTFLSNSISRMFALMKLTVETSTVVIWAQYLIKIGLTDRDIVLACKQAVADPTIDPYRFTVAKLVEYVRPILTNKELAHVAWGKVIAHIRQKGSVGCLPDDVDYATTLAVNSCGGLHVIGDTDENKLGFVQHRFVESYSATAKLYPNNVAIGMSDLPEQLQESFDKALEATDGNKAAHKKTNIL